VLKIDLGITIEGDEGEHNPLYKGSVAGMVWVKTTNTSLKLSVACDIY
jgi:hypothetical protein